MDSEFWAAIVGAIVGSFTAGGISYVLQRQTAVEAAQQRAEERELIRKSLGYSLLFKTIKIYSDFSVMRNYLSEAFNRAKASNPPQEAWQTLLPLANLTDPVHFSPEEMSMLLSLKDDDCFNAVMSLDAVHNAALQSFVTYRDMRRAFTNALPSDAEGVVGTIRLDREQLRHLRPKMIELNSLAQTMLTNISRESDEAAIALTKLRELLNERLGLKIKISNQPGHTPLPAPNK